MDVDELIESHKELRELVIQHNHEDSKMMDEVRKSAEVKIIEHAKKNDLYTIEQLRNLTVTELIHILSYGEG